VTTDHVLVETWLLLNSRHRREIAELFWDRLRGGAVRIEMVIPADLEAAWAIGQSFRHQDFSLVDRTSFAVMQRLGIKQVASFDADFAAYRYGGNRDQAFEIVRSGHSETFRLLHRAILERKQVVFTYGGAQREVCPYILGHKNRAEQVLTFQFAGRNEKGLTVRGQCFKVAEIRGAAVRDGPWHGDAEHRSTQRCVDDVFTDVNTDVPNQPGRR